MQTDSQDTVIYFSAPIQPSFCSSLIQLVSQAVNEGHEEVHLLMNSGGGDIDSGIALYYALRSFPVRLLTYNMSTIGSMAVPVFLAGDSRFAMEHSSFFVHETTMNERNEWQLRTAKFLIDGIEENERRMIAIISDRTGQSETAVKRWANGVKRFDAKAAMRVGLVQDFGEIQLSKDHSINFVLG